MSASAGVLAEFTSFSAWRARLSMESAFHTSETGGDHASGWLFDTTKFQSGCQKFAILDGFQTDKGRLYVHGRSRAKGALQFRTRHSIPTEIGVQ